MEGVKGCLVCFASRVRVLQFQTESCVSEERTEASELPPGPGGGSSRGRRPAGGGWGVSFWTGRAGPFIVRGSAELVPTGLSRASGVWSEGSERPRPDGRAGAVHTRFSGTRDPGAGGKAGLDPRAVLSWKRDGCLFRGRGQRALEYRGVWACPCGAARGTQRSALDRLGSRGRGGGCAGQAWRSPGPESPPHPALRVFTPQLRVRVCVRVFSFHDLAFPLDSEV